MTFVVLEDCAFNAQYLIAIRTSDTGTGTILYFEEEGRLNSKESFVSVCDKIQVALGAQRPYLGPYLGYP